MNPIIETRKDLQPISSVNHAYLAAFARDSSCQLLLTEWHDHGLRDIGIVVMRAH
jgi:nitrate reductase assembly molybdenum cofactor insertion protein NarJ